VIVVATGRDALSEIDALSSERSVEKIVEAFAGSRAVAIRWREADGIDLRATRRLVAPERN